MWTCKELTPNLCDLEVTNGFLTVRGVNISYWKYHRDTSKPATNENDKLPPIVAIHGGPGWPHDYMLPLQQQACRGRDVYFYDQAGCGESRVPEPNASIKKNYPWLLTIEYYTQEELPALVSQLGLSKFHIIASSWGTVLSQYFALDTDRKGLLSMVLSGPLSEAELYIKSQWDKQDGTIGTLPPFVQERIQKLEEDQAYESQEYKDIDEILTTKFTCRTAPLPDCFVRSSERFNKEIYVGMQGASEFTIGGVLGDLNITHRLHELGDLPVFLTHGKYDTMRPAVVEAMFKAIPRAETFFLDKSGHVSMIDEPGKMNDAIADFFDRVESACLSSELFSPKIDSVNVEGRPWQIQVWTLLLAVLLAFFSGVIFGKRKTFSQGQYLSLS